LKPGVKVLATIATSVITVHVIEITEIKTDPGKTKMIEPTPPISKEYLIS